jgi:hypothetical protein
MKGLGACLILILHVWSPFTQALQKEGIEFADQKTLGTTNLQLNGVGLRRARRFGIPFRVYVAGLYVEKKNADADALLAEPGPKFLEMVFLRRVDKASITEAWSEGIYKNCAVDCEHYRDQIRPVNDMMVDVLEKGRIQIRFLADRIEMRVEGRETKEAVFKDVGLTKNLLRAFIGPKPADPDLKKGLLGL